MRNELLKEVKRLGAVYESELLKRFVHNDDPKTMASISAELITLTRLGKIDLTFDSDRNRIFFNHKRKVN